MARIKLRDVSADLRGPGRAHAGGRGAADGAGGVAVTQCDHDGTWLVALYGEHDLTTIPLLARQTSHVWAHCKIAVVDLTDVTFVDTGVVSWLLSVERALEEGEGLTLSVVQGAPGSFTARLFDRLHMGSVLACYATRREAFMQAPAVRRRVAAPRTEAEPRQRDLAA
jgi:ABC-type transporter Mla MlaB component